MIHKKSHDKLFSATFQYICSRLLPCLAYLLMPTEDASPAAQSARNASASLSGVLD
jgi:hypothetical protein